MARRCGNAGREGGESKRQREACADGRPRPRPAQDLAALVDLAGQQSATDPPTAQRAAVRRQATGPALAGTNREPGGHPRRAGAVEACQARGQRAQACRQATAQANAWRLHPPREDHGPTAPVPASASTRRTRSAR